MRLAWASLDSSVVVPDANGVVTAVGVGTTQVQASAGKFDRATVVVLRAARAVTVSPAIAGASGAMLVDDPLKPSDTLRLRAIASDEAGEAVPGVRWIWTSSASAIATVDAAGLVTAKGLGPVTIAATTMDLAGEAITGTFAVTVAPMVQGVVVSSMPARLVVGDTAQLTAITTGPNDQTLSGRSYAWTSSNAAVATVDGTGRVVIRAPGSFTISARTGFVSGTALVSGSTTASAVDVLPRVFTSISAGEDYTCATITLERLHCWGRHSNSVFGVPSVGDTVCVNGFGAGGGASPCTLVPKRAAPTIAIRQISTGRDHVCAMATDGQAYCWGTGGSNGNGTVSGSSAPQRVASPLPFASVSTGDEHSCGLTQSGAAWCWGSDDFGQLGNVKPATSTTPIPVDGDAAYSVISAGNRHTCAVQTTSALHCWGANESGQLGIGSRDSSSTPRDVAPGLGFRTVVASNSNTCALTTSGAAYCWGEGGVGQIGNGGTGDALTPQAVAGGRSFTQIAVGNQHACGLQSDGEVWCWGRYDLGSYSEAAILVPTRLSTDVRFTSIAAGFRHACGLTAAGTVWCWGSNVWGAFGDGLQALWRPTTVLPVMTPATSQ